MKLNRLLYSVAAFVLVFAASTSTVQASNQDSKVVHAQHVILFFKNHPKAAKTSAGQKALEKAADAIAFAEAHPSALEVWVNGSFATCVRWRESQNGAASQNLYEIQGPNAHGNYGDYEWLYGVPRATQDLIAYNLYLRDGVQPWRPYDGC